MQGLIPTKPTLGGALVGAFAAIGLAIATHSAQAAPCVNTTPINPPAQAQGAGLGCALTASNTSVDVVFAFQSAADEDTLSLFGGLIFDNHTSAPGDKQTIAGLTAGETLPFMFADMTVGHTFDYTNAEPATAPDGEPHTAYAQPTTGTGPIDASSANLFFDDSSPRKPVVLDAGVVTQMNAIDPNSADWLFIGFEDRLGSASDFDYNDLIFAFHNVISPPVSSPEPASLAVLGLALGALGLVRRRRAPKA